MRLNREYSDLTIDEQIREPCRFLDSISLGVDLRVTSPRQVNAMSGSQPVSLDNSRQPCAGETYSWSTGPAESVLQSSTSPSQPGPMRHCALPKALVHHTPTNRISSLLKLMWSMVCAESRLRNMQASIRESVGQWVCQNSRSTTSSATLSRESDINMISKTSSIWPVIWYRHLRYP